MSPTSKPMRRLTFTTMSVSRPLIVNGRTESPNGPMRRMTWSSAVSTIVTYGEVMEVR